MNWITTYRAFVVTACLSLATLASSLAQTIGIPTSSPAAPCPGSPVSATVTTTGSFSATNVFTLQLSDEFGTFGSPTTVASVTASPTSATTITLTGTLPTGLTYGTAYRFRVRSSLPVITGGQSGAAITIGTALPGLAATASFCQNTGNQTIAVTSGSNIEWYTGFSAAAAVVGTGDTYTVPTTAAGTNTYYATQTVGGCKSAKASINVIVNAPPSTQPTVSNTSPSYCPTLSPTPLSASTSGTGASIRWYSPPGSTTSGGTTLAAPTTTGTYAYTVSQLSAQGCESAKQFVNVTVFDAPTTIPTIANTSPTYCSSTPPANLSASTNGAGASIRWISPTNVITNAATIPAPTASGTYQVLQLSTNGCLGPQQAVNVTVNPTPSAPTFSNNNQTYCSNAAPSTLSANTVGSGNSLKWYLPANAGGGTLVQTTIPAPTSSGTYSYSVSQVSGAGCEGPQAFLTITINTAPTTVPTVANVTPTYCANNAPANLSAAINGAGASIRWIDPANTVTNAATIPAPTASGTYQVLQVSSNGCTGPVQSVVVTVNPVPAAPTFGNSNQTYCSNVVPATLSANTVGSGNSLKWYLPANAGGGTLVQTTIPAPTSSGTYSYSVSQVSGAGCEGPQAFLMVTINAAPTTVPTVASVSPTYCANALPANLSAAINGLGASIRWTSPNNVVTNAATIPAPTASGTYQVQQVASNGCVGPTQAVNVTVNAVPVAPTLTNANLAYCANAAPATLAANTVGGGNNLKWYTSSGVLQQATIPAPNTAGPYSYSVSQVSTPGCEGPLVVQNVTVYAVPSTTPTIANVTPTYCANALPANLAAAINGAGASIQWTAPNNTVTNSLTIAAPTVSGTYQVQQISTNGCSGPQQAVTVTVNAFPAPPAVSNIVLCQNRTTQQLTATGTGLTWFDAGNTQLPGAPTPSISAIGNTDYFVTQTNGFACISSKAKLTVTVNTVPAPPVATTALTYCAGQTAVALAATGTALQWYGTSQGGSASSQAPVPSTTAGDVGPKIYYVSQTVAFCESDRQAITVTTKRKPGQPTGVINQEFCQTYPAPTLPATAEATGALTWVTLANNSQSATPPVVPNTNANVTYSYAVFQTVDGCASDQAAFTVRVKPTPGQPGITPFQLCQFGPTKALQVTGTQIKYYDANDQLLGSAPTLPVDQPQTLTYKVTQTFDGCEGPKISYSVIVYPKPAPPTTQAVQYCLDQQDQPKQDVKPLTAGGQSLRWFFVDGTAYPDGFTPTPATSSTLVFDYGVTQTINSCQSDKATLRVSVLSTPTPVLSSTLVNYCRNDVAKPFEATGENLTWIDPNGVLTTTTPTPPTFNAISGANYQVYARGSNGCYSARNTVRLVVNTSPTLALMGSTTINYGLTTTLKLKFTSTPPYAYTLSDGTSGTAVDSLATVTVKPLRTTTYQVASVINSCGIGLPGNPATAVVTVNIPTITTPALSATGGLCVNNSFSVGYTSVGTFNSGNAFKVQVADTTAKNYIDVSAASLANPLTATLPPTLKSGPYFVRVVATNPGAEVLGTDSPTILTVRSLPTATLLGTQNVYETYPASLTFVLTGDSPWSISYSQDGGSPISFNTGANPHILAIQPTKTTTYNVLAVTNACGSGVVSGTAVITVLPLLAIEQPLDGAISLYPVPTQAVLTVEINAVLTAQNPAQITLTDLTGHPMLTRSVTDARTQLDLSQQPAGLYLLNVAVGDRRAVRKVMKQ